MLVSKRQLERWYCYEGQTLQQIGDRLGRSRERIRQLMERYGISRRYFHSYRMPHGFKMLDYSKNYSNKRDRAFEKIEDQETAYWVGFLLADGTVYRGSLVLAIKDKDHIMKFKHFLGCNSPIVEAPSTNWETYEPIWILRIGCNRIIHDLAKYRVINKKTHNKRIENIPDGYISHFIRGFFDGDGCVSVNSHKKHPSWIPSLQLTFTSNKKMIENIQSVLVQYCDVKKAKFFQSKQYHTSFILSFSAKQARNVAKWMYSDANVFMTRKKKIFDEYMQLYGNKLDSKNLTN